MNTDDLRRIGASLYAELGRERLVPYASEALGKGAGGDQTFAVDKRAEDIIIQGLEALGEPLSIVSEEAGLLQKRGGGLRVLIDPVDGSKNAITGIPFYCTSIAVADGDTVGAVNLCYVVNLLTGDEFWASKGEGAFFNSRRLSAQRDDVLYMAAYEAPNPSLDIPRIMNLLSAARRTRCFGATALDLAYVAYGSVSVFAVSAPSRSFDFAGGYLLVREAGGICTDITGGPIEGVALDLKRSSPLLASGNGRLHDKALRLLHG